MSFTNGEVSVKTPGVRAPGDCYLVSVDSGEVSKATDMSHPDFGDSTRAPVWDPSSRYLYLLTRDAIWKIEIATRKMVRIPGPEGRDLMWIATSSETNQLVLFRGNSAIVMVRDEMTRKEGFYTIDLSSRETTRLMEDSQSIGAMLQSTYRITTTTNGDHLVYVSEDAQHPRDLWTLDVALSVEAANGY